VEKKKERLLLGNWVIIAAEIFTTIGMAMAFLNHIPKQIPLYYSRPWGEDQLGRPIELLVPLGIAVSCGLIGSFVYKKMTADRVLGRLILVSSMVIQLILSLGVLRIVLLVS
jgi:hypothetical protein